MPIKSCQLNGKPGYKYGDSGKCYTYSPGDEGSKARARSKAEKQAAAIRSQGYGMNEEPMRFGYWVDLNAVSLDDSGDAATSWIMAVPMGTYQHPTYGEINFTPNKVQNMAHNIQNKIREQQLDVDYDHKAQDGRAAGWITGASALDDGLYVQVEWTNAAKNAIANKEYKYFSPEYQDKWKHPKTGTFTRRVPPEVHDLTARTHENSPHDHRSVDQ